MTTQIRCKRIIDGRTYNTETAMQLGEHEDPDAPYEHALFKTRHGAYFLWTTELQDNHEWIKPYTLEEAQQWTERYCRAEVYAVEFGEVPEAGDPEARITLRIPETLRRRLADIAKEREQSLNAWILRCLERCSNEMGAANE